ncbi:MAG: permease-like cell division protein FtsX [Lachnospiraceae bacterium]|nr:permease-like cell division protein FtsX [Lachnospiraceae bacterium]
MKINTLRYSFKQGFINIRRNLLFSLASLGTIIACLFMLGVFYSVVLNMRHEVKMIEDSLTVTVFFEKGIDEQRIMAIGDEIKSIANVDTINYVSSDVAWKSYVDDVYNGDMNYVQNIFGEDNPLEDAASYEITLKDISRQEETVTTIKAIPNVRKVNSSDGTAQSLNSISRLVGYASLGLILILLLVSMFLISNTITIGISVRKDEIAIMKLIGAKDSFVRTPFLVEGVMIGLIGSIIPMILLFFMYDAVVDYLTAHYNVVANLIHFVSTAQVIKGVTPISLLLGIGIGFVASFVTTHKHLHV